MLDKKERRQIGAHYTTEANILKVIRSLFLDELHAELGRAKGDRRKLEELHGSLSKLRIRRSRVRLRELPRRRVP